VAKWRRAGRAEALPARPVANVGSAPAPTITGPCAAADPATGWTITPIVAASLCIKPRGLLTPHQAAKVDSPKSASSEFTAMRRLAMRFRGVLRSRETKKFGVWLEAQQSGIYAMKRFARTVRRDLDASPTP